MKIRALLSTVAVVTGVAFVAPAFANEAAPAPAPAKKEEKKPAKDAAKKEEVKKEEKPKA